MNSFSPMEIEDEELQSLTASNSDLAKNASRIVKSGTSDHSRNFNANSVVFWKCITLCLLLVIGALLFSDVDKNPANSSKIDSKINARNPKKGIDNNEQGEVQNINAVGTPEPSTMAMVLADEPTITPIDITSVPSQQMITQGPSLSKKTEENHDFLPASPTIQMADSSILPEHYVVHPFYEDDLSFRRVCAIIGKGPSHICLTIKYPFEIEPQDPFATYAKPFQEEFDNNLLLPLDIIDIARIEFCKQNFTDISMAANIRQCVQYYFDQAKAEKAVACWSREVNGIIQYYDIGSDQQKERMHAFFHQQIIFGFGMSPMPPIFNSFSQIFGKCFNASPFVGKMFGRGQLICVPNGVTPPKTWDDLLTTDVSWTMLLHVSVLMQGQYVEPGHPYIPRLEKVKNVTGIPSSRLQFSIFNEHPIAHLQNEDRFQKDYEATAAGLEAFVKDFMTEKDNEGRLEAMGIEISNVITFDGSPQFNPTQSGAYHGNYKASPNSEEAFLERKGYEGWIPEYGSKCRGFLPGNSNLTKFNDLGRSLYEQHGQDMSLYGRTWEFINLVWYDMKGWKGKNGLLDCTHGKQGLVSNMHKYIFMALIDNAFENPES